MGWRNFCDRGYILNALRDLVLRLGLSRKKPEGGLGILLLGHRDYVGGRWDEIGKLQFEFIVQHGLQPSSNLLDVGCGSLRGGVHFIRYLESGHYLGIDKEKKLIDLGIKKELGRRTHREKSPQFVISSKFEFSRFTKRPDYSIAQSLFTHLNVADIQLCLGNLRSFVGRGHVFYATFFEGTSAKSDQASHSHKGFVYTKEELTQYGTRIGWRPEYIGDWNHPRNQKMMKFLAV
jgi:hypothetical protein